MKEDICTMFSRNKRVDVNLRNLILPYFNY